MAISTLCLLQFRTSPAELRHAAAVIAKADHLDDGVLLHTSLDFSADPEALALAIRKVLGEPLAKRHADTRGVLLIPSVALPTSRTYASVVEEVGEGGVWVRWSAPLAEPQMPDLKHLFNQMLGQMPGGVDDAALRNASAALPGLLANPDELAQLVQNASAQLPPLDNMLRGLGIDLSSPELQRLTGQLAGELARDPNKLAALTQQLFDSSPDEDEDEDDNDEDNVDGDGDGDNAPQKPHRPR